MERTSLGTQTGRGVLVAPMAQVMTLLGEWGRRRQMRKSFGLCSEVLLRDIGLTPDDLLQAMDQPLGEDSSDALLRAAMARAGNW
jgi:uncharacterized protein YjiS (DUF1127 family)